MTEIDISATLHGSTIELQPVTPVGQQYLHDTVDADQLAADGSFAANTIVAVPVLWSAVEHGLEVEITL